MAYELQTQISGTERQFNANACAGFAHYQLWGTPYSSKQCHSYQPVVLRQIASIMQKGRLLEEGDWVAWETLSFHHAFIAEDWRVLLTNSDQFMLKSRRFFNRSLAIGLAE